MAFHKVPCRRRSAGQEGKDDADAREEQRDDYPLAEVPWTGGLLDAHQADIAALQACKGQSRVNFGRSLRMSWGILCGTSRQGDDLGDMVARPHEVAAGRNRLGMVVGAVPSDRTRASKCEGTHNPTASVHNLDPRPV